ncbi:hypothetical protein ACFX10_010048 [Malus domestica]
MGNIVGQDFRDYWRGLCIRFRDNDRQEDLLQECVFVLWRIWKSRNEMVFNGVLVNHMEMVHVVRKQILEFRSAKGVERGETDELELGLVEHFAGQPIRWKRPMFGVLKINCDGAWCGKTGKGGYGWVLRDFAGMLLAAGGVGGLSFSTAAMAEVKRKLLK